jgi:nitrous oxidase accessory protein
MRLFPPSRSPAARWLCSSLAFLAILFPVAGFALPSLQIFVDVTPMGGTLRPPPGVYAGPVVISRAITLDGQDGQVVIDSEGEGTVLTIRGDNVTVRGLRLTHSGDSHDQVDAGLLIEADKALVEDNVLDDVLFGIHIRQGNDNVVRRNKVSSRPYEPSLRGEGFRMWYSRGNLIEENEFYQVRDLLITNSAENRIIGNSIEKSRVGMEFVFSPDNQVHGNRISENTTGIVVLYSNGMDIRNNRLQHMRSPSGSALAIKESSQMQVEGNEIIHCAVGLTANTPTHAENILYLRNNTFAYNDVAMYFYGEKGGHIVHNNHLRDNLTHVAVSAPTSALANDWRNNLWDDYQGFDRDGDGIGDTPHDIHLYADRLWMDRPMTRFFRGSPVLEVIDLMERLAPFSEPDMILSDPTPRMN